MTRRRLQNGALGIALTVLAAVGSIGPGCAAKRYVTATYWHDGDALFVAYREVVGTANEGRVKHCRRRPDNTLECRELDEVARLLRAP